ncbi:hypothetical protein ACFC63_15250 [Streptomyces albidoflavus]
MAAHCVLLTEPYGEGEQADYGVEQTFSFGLDVPVPLLGVELETAGFPTCRPSSGTGGPERPAYPASGGAVTKSISSSTRPSKAGSRSL